ncbi:MAG: DUF4339 domain-containing protein [Xanthomonadales bacterium]|jgi:hypothetical protein|nr:DUF4339 domain-containing protein [Xanthomonadales bacterium]MBK7145041.1 DUF4339 domain-containing protein [Xanthomonadales bacterium]MCC6561943.1 DUF4339 domain-containing protein [Xanthomonadales bacterium]
MSEHPKEIWIGRGNDQLGPHDLDKIRQLQAQGSLQANDLLWWDGLAEWTARDAALAMLGIEIASPAPIAPPPMPTRAEPPPMPAPPPARPRPTAAPAAVAAGASPERTRALMFMFAGLIMFAVLAAAAFAFLRMPASSRPVFGRGASELRDALAAASLYKVAYAEYVMSTDKVPKSLAEIGFESAPIGALQEVRIQSGTLLLHTSYGTLALQPYRNSNYQIDFRCGFAAPPIGMQPLGTIDSASTTSIDRSDLPDDCR